MKKHDHVENLWIAVCMGSLIIQFTSCELIFETPLTDERLIIIMPADSLETEISTQTFWWEPVPESKGYNLQIVSPHFDTILRLIIDTSVTTEKLEYSLYPGRFQWRVRAFNSNSSTAYFARTFTILNTYDLSNQSVVLKSPHANYITRDTTIVFSWYYLNNATDYRFELKFEDWEGEYVLNPILTDLNMVTVNLVEGTFAWGVQGQNQNSGSIFTHRSFMIDRTPPGTPIPNTPGEDEEILETEVSFTWTRPDIAGSTVMDSLYISADSLFSDVERMHGYYLVEPEFRTDISEPGRYFWRVRSIDAAGNKSNYSLIRRFTRKDEE